MARKYLAFDLETTKVVPGEDFNWRPHRPLGISCAAAFPCDAEKPVVWHGKKADGAPAEGMSQTEAQSIVAELTRFVENGYTIATWNGLGFDFDILAEESSNHEDCRRLALDHVDLMFHVFCDRGFRVALDKAAKGLGIPGKPAGVSGLVAPQLWAQGRYEEVLEYVAHDVRIALQIATNCDTQRRFKWITRKGTSSSMNLPRGWLSVRDAMRLPEPDTSWMGDPAPRSDFTQWLGLGA